MIFLPHMRGLLQVDFHQFELKEEEEGGEGADGNPPGRPSIDGPKQFSAAPVDFGNKV